MTRRVRGIAAVACLVLAGPRPVSAHGGVPARVVANRRAGPYLVSVWAEPDVGMGRLYVVYGARGGAPVVAPAAVRVGVAPVSGRLPEVVYEAHPERVRYGARFVAHVAFDRGEAWRVRVVSDGPAGQGEVRAVVNAIAPGGPGPLGLALYAVPFVLVGGLWWRAAAARRRAPAGRAALASR